MSAVLIVIYTTIIVGICVAAISMILFHKEQSSTAPVSQIVSPTNDVIVPFTYNIPVDSHMKHTTDVAIVVEQPDEHIWIGMPAR
jgi:hypothetical protein